MNVITQESCLSSNTKIQMKRVENVFLKYQER